MDSRSIFAYRFNDTVMRTIRALLLITLWTGLTLSSSAQSSGRGPIATTVTGHMAVTLLSPAALSATQNLEFNDIKLRSSQAPTVAVDYDMSLASVHVSGSKSMYSVTVSNSSYGFSQNGRALSVSNFSTVSSNEDSGSNEIYIGATMSIRKREALAVVENNTPLAITVNYN